MRKASSPDRKVSAEVSATAVTLPRQFIFRTPLLSVADYTTWADGLAAGTALGHPERIADAIASDVTTLRARLRAIVARPEVRAALFVASPDLDQSLVHWFDQPDGDRGQRVERALVRYVSRMARRCTPFGLFAGVSCGIIGDHTRLSLGSRSQYQRHSRLDNDYLLAVTAALGEEPAIRGTLCLRPNPTLYKSAGRIRYVETRVVGTVRSHHLVAVEASVHVTAALEAARDGALGTDVAQRLLSVDPDADVAEAFAFVDDLVDNQVLVHGLQPTVTGSEPICRVIATLREAGAADKADRLAEAQHALDAIDREGVGADVSRHRAITSVLKELSAKVQPRHTIQVDMIKPVVDATLGTEVVEEIYRGVALLARMAPRPREGPFDDFCRRFAERYETREVPLLEVLDEELGIGFLASRGPGAEGSPLLANFPFRDPHAPQGRTWTAREAHLLRRVQEVLGEGGAELNLSDTDVEVLSGDEPVVLPDAYSTLCVVAARSCEQINQGRFRILVFGMTGPSGARMSARFCHASPEVHAAVLDHLRAEEALEPDAVFAEIVHLPAGRTGNILCRPLLRAWEIPFMGESGAPRDQQISLDDLLVSVQGRRVVLRSRRLRCEVLPRLTSAHNFSQRSLGVYRFLCTLQSQGISNVAWSWGPLDDAPFLPRVTHGRLVFARARWLLTRTDLDGLEAAARRQSRADDTPETVRARIFAAAQALRQRHKLPRYILVGDGDNELPVDLDNVLSVDSFVRLVRSRRRIILHEDYPLPDEFVVDGPEGPYGHQLLVSFVRKRPPTHRPRSPRVEDSASQIARQFPPLSEWLYMKLYTGPATADDILRTVISRTTKTALSTGIAQKWFFVRYADPDWHLRIRFHGDPRQLQAELMPQLRDVAESLLGDGRVWRVQFDTYEREVERYGGPQGIAVAEEFAWYDSDAVLEVLTLLTGDNADARWRIAARGIHLILADFNLDLDQRIGIMTRLRQALGVEFEVDSTFKKHLADRYRAERHSLRTLLASDALLSTDDLLQGGVAVLARRSERHRLLAKRLCDLSEEGLLTTPLDSIIASLIHMHANRLFRFKARAHELVLYDLLQFHYQSVRARGQSLAESHAT